MTNNQTRKQLQTLLNTPAAQSVVMFDLVGKTPLTAIQQAIEAAIRKSGRVTVCIISS